MSVSVETLPELVPEDVLRARQRERMIGFGVFAALAVVAFVVAHEVPKSFDSGIQQWAQDRYKWSIINRSRRRSSSTSSPPSPTSSTGPWSM